MAATVKVAVAGAVTVTLVGWIVIIGAPEALTVMAIGEEVVDTPALSYAMAVML